MIKTILKSRLKGTLKAPSSKSITHRALLCAALAPGTSTITDPLVCDDTEVTLDALKVLGVIIHEKAGSMSVTGTHGQFKPKTHHPCIDLQNSGTSLRLLLPIAFLSNSRTTLTGTDRLCQRPLKQLILPLLALHGSIESANFHPPITTSQSHLKGGILEMDASDSSQFVSALLIVAPFMENSLTLRVSNLVSSPYVESTISVMKHFGVSVLKSDSEYTVRSGQEYKACHYAIEGDYSSASYFMAAAAITNSALTITNLPSRSTQADLMILDILKQMGCGVLAEKKQVKILPKPLHGITIDMKNCPDLVPSVAVLASYATGKTRIYNIKHLRVKESDRISALETELSKTGIHISSTDDELIIEGGKMLGARIDVHNDHRMAMSLAVAGLKSKTPMVIENADAVNKSYPNFWKDFDSLGGTTQ